MIRKDGQMSAEEFDRLLEEHGLDDFLEKIIEIEWPEEEDDDDIPF